jgi:type IV secretory pathway protease TraF
MSRLSATRRVKVAAILLGVLALALPSARSGPPQLLWNATASAPEGLYRVQPKRRLRVGDCAAVQPTRALSAWLAQRGYLPAGALLVKHVAAVAPSEVCRAGVQIRIAGRPAAGIRTADRWGRALPSWRGCRRLQAGEIFFLNPAAGSFDSRYLGPLPRTSVVGRATPLWLTQEAGDVGCPS